jgi:outer membrane protein OmpA-like peptidoglycan-associated protein
VERERIEQELNEVGASLESAERYCMKLEGDAAELEAKLAKALTVIEQKQQILGKLRAERDAAKKATQDLTKLANLETQMKQPKQENPKKQKEIEIELSGSIGYLEHAVAQLRVCFKSGATKVCVGDPEQAVALPKIADLVKAQKSSKFLLEGHCESGEKEGTDYERCLAVFEWLVEAALCPPGSLRMKGLKSARGEGSCVVVVLIEELEVRSGPISPELAVMKARPGVYFSASSKELEGESKSILAKMASWLSGEDDTYIRVEGHTEDSEKGALAMQRAQAVADYLIGLGVRSKQLKVTGCSNRHPASRLHCELNRRVELHVD